MRARIAAGADWGTTMVPGKEPVRAPTTPTATALNRAIRMPAGKKAANWPEKINVPRDNVRVIVNPAMTKPARRPGNTLPGYGGYLSILAKSHQP